MSLQEGILEIIFLMLIILELKNWGPEKVNIFLLT